MYLNKREIELILMTLEHYVDCEIEEKLREEMKELIKKLHDYKFTTTS